ncbi:MAG: AAA-like domain-containing protein [Coleofasciculaceae cyanobacterium]
MTIDELITLVCSIEQKQLTPAQELVLRRAWQGETYNQMAVQSIYEVDYLKTTASRLWQVISSLLNQPVSKANFRQTVESLALTSQQREIVEEFNRYSTLSEARGKAGESKIINLPFLDYPSGPVPIDSLFYTPRPPLEEQAYQEISQPTSVVRIEAPKKMGKTSLMLRILAHGDSLGYKTVNLDFQQIDTATLSDLNKFLRWFCIRVSQELNLKPNLSDFWHETLGCKASCTLYFKCYLLERIEQPLVLALSQLERIFEYPSLSQEFFPLLRSWYEEAQRLETWQKLRLVAVYSTEAYVTFKLNQSPLDMGLPLELPEFTVEQIQTLARLHRLNWTDTQQAEQLMVMIGGHPALVRLTLYHLSYSELTLNQIWQDADTEAGIYREHLRRHLTNLKANPKLAEAFKEVVAADSGVTLDCITTFQLKSLGIVKLNRDEVTPRCHLYRLYFRKQLY